MEDGRFPFCSPPATELPDPDRLRPALRHAVEGRLGRPLSEDPEFWRAAPEAALQWSAEEFGFPDPRRGDDPLGTDRFYHASSAAGHLHAAGLQI